MLAQAQEWLQHWELIAFAIVALLAIRSYLQGQTKLLRHLVRAAVSEAQEMFGEGTGPIKREHVMAVIYSRIPVLLRPLITEERIDEWIDLALDWMEASLEHDPDAAGN